MEKVSFSDIQSRQTIFNNLTAEDKICLLNRDNLMQPIQIKLFQKQKTFYAFFFFFAFLKPIVNFQHFPKRDEPHS